MNRILTSLLTIALLASCAKTEVQYESTSEIGFAPVSKISAKAAVPGTDYPASLPMFVFANAGLPDATYPDGYSEPYFVKAEFIHRSNNIFGGDPAYYWPNVKKLIFSGVSKSGNIGVPYNAPSRFVYEANSYEQTTKYEIEIDGYMPTTGDAYPESNDLMWFPTTGPYSKRTEAISVEMKHACAWITININGDAITGAANTTWKITKVKFEDLSQSGNVILGESANWTSVADGTPATIYGPTAGKPLTESFVDYTQKLDIYFTFSNLIVVPQSTKRLHVTYKFVSQKGGGPNGTDLVITESKDIPLTYSGDNGWEAGKHYTYNITIGTKEILVDPTVTTWDPQVVTNVQI